MWINYFIYTWGIPPPIYPQTAQSVRIKKILLPLPFQTWVPLLCFIYQKMTLNSSRSSAQNCLPHAHTYHTYSPSTHLASILILFLKCQKLEPQEDFIWRLSNSSLFGRGTLQLYFIAIFLNKKHELILKNKGGLMNMVRRKHKNSLKWTFCVAVTRRSVQPILWVPAQPSFSLMGNKLQFLY